MTDVQTRHVLTRKLVRVLCALLLALVLLAALAWVVGAFAYRTNLSQTSSVISAFPDVKISAGGEYVAVVWADGMDSSHDYGKIRLKRSPVLTSPFWAEHKAVFDPNTSAGKGQSPRLAFGPTITEAHVVWLWGSSNVPTQTRYSKCNISTSGMTSDCNPNGEVIDTVSVVTHSLVQPDIAIDGNGIPHAVWVEDGKLRYSHRTGGSWSPPTDVSTGPGAAPTIAYARDVITDYLHLAWVLSSTQQVQYIPGQISGTTASWGASREFAKGSNLSDSGGPSIAAVGSDVILAWDAKVADGIYAVAYNYSSDSGVGWQTSGAEWRLVPTGGYEFPFPDRVKRTSPESGGTYTRRLQPDVTLEITTTSPYTIVHVVWHEQITPGDEGTERHDVFYSSADFNELDAASCSGDCWLTPTNVTSDTKSVDSKLNSASAAIAVGKGFTHTVYMEQIQAAPNYWGEVIYNGDLNGAGAGGVYLPVILKNSY